MNFVAGLSLSYEGAIQILNTEVFEVMNNYIEYPMKSPIVVTGNYGIVSNNMINFTFAPTNIHVHVKSNGGTSYITGNTVINYDFVYNWKFICYSTDYWLWLISYCTVCSSVWKCYWVPYRVLWVQSSLDNER